MAFTREEWIASLNENQRHRREREPAPASLLRMAAVSMDKLTGSEEWDAYLKLVAARIDDLEQSITATREALSSPTIVVYEEMIALKIRLAGHEGAIVALRDILALPRSIMEGDKGASNG